MSYSILVVDDEAKIRPLYEQKFFEEIERGECSIHFAHDGQAALEFIEKNDVDIVFSDINMPGMDGLELLRRINAANPLVKTIMVTAYGDMQNIRTAMNLGAFDFITKPINFADLKTTLQKTLAWLAQVKEASAYRNDVISARKVLESFLPTHPCRDGRLDLAGVCVPARIVGGDFYDYYCSADGEPTTLMIADVCGKGMPAALLTYFVRHILRILRRNESSPAALLTALNLAVIDLLTLNEFVTVCLGVVDGEVLRVASAGHCPLLVLRPGEERIREYKPKGLPVGVLPRAAFAELAIPIAPGDLVVFYSDGITDAVNAADEFYGEERLNRVLLGGRDAGAQDLLRRVLDDVKRFTGTTSQYDDMTLMVLRVK